MARRNLTQKGFTLINLTVAMGLFSIIILVSFQMLKHKNSFLKRAIEKNNEALMVTSLVKALKEDTKKAVQILSNSGNLSLIREQSRGDRIEIFNYDYETVDCTYNGNATTCLKRTLPNGGEKIFTSIKSINWCHEVAKNDCSFFDYSMPVGSSPKRVLIQVVDQTGRMFNLALELKNMIEDRYGSNSTTSRDDIVILK
jgi:hypothetical protein